MLRGGWNGHHRKAQKSQSSQTDHPGSLNFCGRRFRKATLIKGRSRFRRRTLLPGDHSAHGFSDPQLPLRLAYIYIFSSSGCYSPWTSSTPGRRLCPTRRTLRGAIPSFALILHVSSALFLFFPFVVHAHRPTSFSSFLPFSCFRPYRPVRRFRPFRRRHHCRPRQNRVRRKSSSFGLRSRNPRLVGCPKPASVTRPKNPMLLLLYAKIQRPPSPPEILFFSCAPKRRLPSPTQNPDPLVSLKSLSSLPTRNPMSLVFTKSLSRLPTQNPISLVYTKSSSSPRAPEMIK